MYNILICDDEQDIVNALKIYLSGGDYCLFEASNGREALEVVEKNDIHLILMDIMMPQLDGIAATAKLREKSNVPIILLTAKSESSDKVLGLNIGADDYITKPFDPVEVLARVRSQLRRYTQLGAKKVEEQANVYTVGPIVLDEEKKSVTVDGDSSSCDHAHRVQHPAAADEEPGTHLFLRPDLRAGVEGGFAGGGDVGERAHPPPAAKIRDQPLRAALPEGRVGAGV